MCSTISCPKVSIPKYAAACRFVEGHHRTCALLQHLLPLHAVRAGHQPPHKSESKVTQHMTQRSKFRLTRPISRPPTFTTRTNESNSVGTHIAVAYISSGHMLLLCMPSNLPAVTPELRKWSHSSVLCFALLDKCASAMPHWPDVCLSTCLRRDTTS
jgi:hypothetical protein